ncbi:MAG: SDR family oxidoreductase [Gammaproteobacteria bacterium]
MRLLVLGANSQLGLALTRLLQAQGVDFQALARTEVNLLKQAEVVKAVGRISPTQVINVATYSNLEKAENDPEAARECDIVNTQGVSTLAEVCQHLNLPLLHHSTSFVFDGQKVHPYTEDDETNPVCRYGMSKWYGERAIRDALPLHIILRTDWLFSRDRPGFFQQHIDNCKRNGGRLEVMNHRFSPTPAADAARVLLAIARQVDCAAEVWGTYHYCAMQPMSQETFVEQFLHEAGKYDPALAAVLPQLQITKLPVQKPYIGNTVLSTQRIFETFGIKQRSRAGELTALLQRLYGVEEPEPQFVEDEEEPVLDPPRKPRARPKAKAKKRP